MTGRTPFKAQKGVALILSLLLLFVLVILGVSGFNNTHLQERAAGNARLQMVAFEAASAGANNAINFFKDTAGRPADPDQLCGSSEHPGWVGAGPDFPPIPTAWVPTGNVGDATIRQRLYCLADEFPCEVDEVGCLVGQRPPRSQLFVQSRGEVTAPDGKIVAQRDVEVRLEIGQSGGGAGDGCGAICMPACDIGTLDFGPSNAFQVDGGSGPNGDPAITTGCERAEAMVYAEANENGRYGNYIGGVDTTAPGSPWDSPENVENFRLNLVAAALAKQATGTCLETCYAAGNLTLNGNKNLGLQTVYNNDGTVRTPAVPQVTYIEGNADFGGNVTGAGILVVNGNLHWGGTPKFEGLILVLGGTFDFSGGGQGGNGGGVVLLNSPTTVDLPFDPVNFIFNGGGNALYKYNCTALQAARALLGEGTEGFNMWNPECNAGSDNYYQAGPEELIIASWRENIGWREELFGE